MQLGWYRDENKTIIDFEPSDSLVVGSRQKHLIGQKITVATSNEVNDITVDWSKIFIEGKATVIKGEGGKRPEKQEPLLNVPATK
mgnify:FL=1